MSDFSHLNSAGEANMVDVSAKQITHRTAIAQATVVLPDSVMQQVRDNNIAKGDLLATARIAGIQAAKKCADLIPLCHPLPLTKVSIQIEPIAEPVAETLNRHQNGPKSGLIITALCKTDGKTGVEMEALTAASVAALTIYDMCKALDKSIVISEVKLLEKQGGKSGQWVRTDD